MKLPSKFFLGDSLIILVSLIFIIFAFKTFWHFETGSVVQVNFQGKTYGNFSLFQDKKISLIGHEGESMIEIKDGLNEGDVVVLNPKSLSRDSKKDSSKAEKNDAPTSPSSKKKDKKSKS